MLERQLYHQNQFKTTIIVNNKSGNKNPRKKVAQFELI